MSAMSPMPPMPPMTPGSPEPPLTLPHRPPGPTRRRALALALAPLAAGVLPACGRGSKLRTQQVPAGAPVLALGDSLTYGTGAAPGQDYPAVLAARTGWRVTNAGVPGDTAAQGLQRLPALLAAEAPSLVIVSLGGNDFLRRLDEADTRAAVRACARQALDAGAQVLLVAVPRLSLLAAAGGPLTDHPLYAEIASELAIPLHRQGWAKVLADGRLRSDAVHANAEGYAQFAHGLADAARALGLWAG